MTRSSLLNPLKPIMIILFLSWGSPTGHAEAVSSTQATLEDAQCISTRLHHNLDLGAFSHLLSSLMLWNELRYAAQVRQRDVFNYIWRLTNGHPGAVRAILDLLSDYEVSISIDICMIFKLTYVLWSRIYLLFRRLAQSKVY
jgi:hypothetical protein